MPEPGLDAVLKAIDMQPELTSEDLEKVKIVLGDALSYELWMFESAAQRMESKGFPDLDDYTRNATIETFLDACPLSD